MNPRTRERRTRRSSVAQRAVIGTGIAGALGASVAIGGQLHTAGATGKEPVSTPQQAPAAPDRQRPRPSRQSTRPQQSRPTSRPAPQPQPQPGSTTASHSTTSGS